MDHRRRQLLLMAGTTVAATAAGRAGAADRDPPVTFDAHALEAVSSTAPRLSYRDAGLPPVLRVARGDLVRITLKNSLAEPTALNWHGVRSETAVDVVPGLAGTPLAPGTTGATEMRARESGSFWFHPPFVPGWSDQTSRGLAGVLIVEEPVPPPVDDDLVLFLSDRVLSRETTLAENLAVNGKPWPEAKTYSPGARIRLRLVNGSTRRALAASFEGARALVIAIDGQPSELFRPLNDTLPVGPGARFDVLIDLPKDEKQSFRLLLRGVEEAASSPEAVFLARLEGTPKADRAPIAALEPNPALPRAIALEKATRVELAVQKIVGGKAPGASYAINGAGSIALPKTPLFTAKRNSAVTLGIVNHTADLIGLRLHGQAMRLLHAMDDGWEPYWRDSVLVSPAKTVHVSFVVPYPGQWLIDSPFFDQATAGLRHWFEVR